MVQSKAKKTICPNIFLYFDVWNNLFGNIDNYKSLKEHVEGINDTNYGL